MNPVVVLRNEVDSFDSPDRKVIAKALMFWCPGCEYQHRIVYWRENSTEVWGWDGNEQAPTITPSILVTWDGEVDGKPVKKICHSFINNGVWDFLTDSTHHLAGQKVPMVPVPDWMVKDK